jgi:hypothetical protein
MLDKVRNQKLFFISLIGIVVVSMIMTFTYAFQTLHVNYKDGSDTNLSVSAGVFNNSSANSFIYM